MDAIPDFRRDVLVSIRPIYASKILLSRDSRAAQRIEVPDHVGDSCFGCPSVGQPAESCLVAVGQYAPQPACCNPRPCANSEFSFGPKGYSPRGGGTPLRVRGNVPLDSMHPTLMHLLC